MNLYQYALNSPVNYIDILGLHLGDAQSGPGKDGEIGGTHSSSSTSDFGDGNPALDKEELADDLFGPIKLTERSPTDYVLDELEESTGLTDNEIKSIILASLDITSALASRPNIYQAGYVALGMATDLSTILNSGVPDPNKNGKAELGLGFSIGGFAMAIFNASPTGLTIGTLSLGISFMDVASQYPDVTEGWDFVNDYKGRCR